jgi:hypothetical protein
MRQSLSGISWALLVAVIMFPGSVSAAENPAVPTFEDENLRLRLSPRSTEQMAGFFEARGFPAAMIQQLSGYCFFTVVIKNKMNKPLWLDLSEWEFLTDQQRLSRIPRSSWPSIWEALHIPLAAQATFRWTLLPESLQFYANESEGGNIILQKTDRPFVLRARFAVGAKGDPLIATINGVRCAAATGKSQ